MPVHTHTHSSGAGGKEELRNKEEERQVHPVQEMRRAVCHPLTQNTTTNPPQLTAEARSNSTDSLQLKKRKIAGKWHTFKQVCSYAHNWYHVALSCVHSCCALYFSRLYSVVQVCRGETNKQVALTKVVMPFYCCCAGSCRHTSYA